MNENIKKAMKIAFVTENIRINRLAQSTHIMRDEHHNTKRMLNAKLGAYIQVQNKTSRCGWFLLVMMCVKDTNTEMEQEKILY